MVYSVGASPAVMDRETERRREGDRGREKGSQRGAGNRWKEQDVMAKKDKDIVESKRDVKYKVIKKQTIYEEIKRDAEKEEKSSGDKEKDNLADNHSNRDEADTVQTRVLSGSVFMAQYVSSHPVWPPAFTHNRPLRLLQARLPAVTHSY